MNIHVQICVWVYIFTFALRHYRYLGGIAGAYVKFNFFKKLPLFSKVAATFYIASSFSTSLPITFPVHYFDYSHHSGCEVLSISLCFNLHFFND